MINLKEYSYSIRNSYFAISLIESKLCIRNVGHGDENPCILFSIDLVENNITNIETTIDSITLYDNDNKCYIFFDDINCLKIKCTFPIKIGFNPQKYEYASRIKENIVAVNLYSKGSKLLFTSDDTIDVEQNWNVISSEDLQIKLTNQITKITLSDNNFSSSAFTFDKDCTFAKGISQDFLSFWNIKEINYQSKRFEAQYILWSGFVHAKGHLKYDACYMSKNIMTNIWSWDNCFVSLSLAHTQPQRAFEQFMSFEHVQSNEGNYPDFMNPYNVSYDFTKPPVQGVIYLELMKIDNDYFSDKTRLKKVYATCEKLLNYWIHYRTYNQAYQLPFNSHGNDTGLDNATIFDNSVTTRSPDLIVYLLKLIELLNYIGDRLKIKQDRVHLEKLLVSELSEKMFNGEKFDSYDVFTSEINEHSKSIIELIPILVYDLLPKGHQRALISNFSNFVTEYGIASESPKSKYYKSDGYWRGPIWAPTTCLCYIGLKNSDAKLATDIKEKYISLCNKSGFAENFDALTGQGLSDKAFAWTAAVYEYFLEENE